MKTESFTIGLFIIALVSCKPIATVSPTEIGATDLVKIINHEKPNLQVEFSPFKNFGCNLSFSDWYRCEENSLLHSLGCTYVEEIPLLGGLTPKYPIAACILEINEHSNVADIPDSCLYYDGGFVTECYRYVIYKDKSYQLVNGVEGFREFYTPVDSPDEALGFVLANDNFDAHYGQIKHEEYIYFVDVLEDTFVEAIADGYLVHVFISYSTCDAIETKAVQVKVTYDGHLTELSKTLSYRDPTQIGCE